MNLFVFFYITNMRKGVLIVGVHAAGNVEVKLLIASYLPCKATVPSLIKRS